MAPNHRLLNWLLRYWRVWLPATIAASCTLALLREAEAACWRGGLDPVAAGWHVIWLAPYSAFVLVLWARTAQRHGVHPTWPRVGAATLVLTLLTAVGIRAWAGFDPFVQLQCALVATQRAPEDVGAWLALGDQYSRLAGEEYPPSWSRGSMPPGERVESAIDWQDRLMDQAEGAYYHALDLAPDDWRPSERIARVAFSRDECEMGRRFLAQARRRAEAALNGDDLVFARGDLGAAHRLADLCERFRQNAERLP